MDQPAPSSWLSERPAFSLDVFRGLPVVRTALDVRQGYRKRRFFARVMRLVENEELPCLLVGGYGLDARRGRLTRPHADVDLSLLANHREEVVNAFREAGFRIRQDRGSKVVASMGTLHVDLFLWKDLGNGQAEHQGPPCVARTVRLPVDALLRGRRVRFQNRLVRIPSDAYFLGTSPFVPEGPDRDYAQTLQPETALRCEVWPALGRDGYDLFSWWYVPGAERGARDRVRKQGARLAA